MSDRKVVIFETSDIDAEERLIREYVVPAFHRLDGRDGVRWLTFNRYGADPSVDGGEVTFSVFGDVETVAARERGRWDLLVEEGVADDWWTDDAVVRVDELDETEVLRHRMRATASRMSVEFFEEFDELPGAVQEFEAEEHFDIGSWMCIHHLINQLGYQRDDGEEEIDLLFENLRNRLYALADGVSTARAEAKTDELVAELRSLPAQIRRSAGEGGEHEHRYADRDASGKG